MKSDKSILLRRLLAVLMSLMLVFLANAAMAGDLQDSLLESVSAAGSYSGAGIDSNTNLPDANRAQLDMMHAYEAWDLFNDYFSEHRSALQPVNVGVYDTCFYPYHADLKYASIQANLDDVYERYAANLAIKYAYEHRYGDPLITNLQDLYKIIHSDDEEYKDALDGIMNYSHGTHVFGIIGANHHNNKGIKGMYPAGIEEMVNDNGDKYYVSHMHALGRATDDIINNNADRPEGYYQNAARYDPYARLIAANDVKVLNVSFGLGHQSFVHFAEIAYGDGEFEGIAHYLQNLLNNGHDFIIVCAAGNNEMDARFDNPHSYISRDMYPDIYDRIVVVANTNTDYTLSTNTNYGPRIDVCAPGNDVLSTVPDGYAKMSGSSMSAPYVSGIAAMVWTLYPEATGADVKRIILESASHDSVTDTQRSGTYDLVNAMAAVEQAISEAQSVVNTITTLPPSMPEAPSEAEPEPTVMPTAQPTQIPATPQPNAFEDVIDGIINTYPLIGLDRVSAREYVIREGISEWYAGWDEDALTGLICADITDYDGDGSDELLLVVYDRGHSQHLIMMEQRGGQYEISALKEVMLGDLMTPELIYSSLRISDFTWSHNGHQYIAAAHDDYDFSGHTTLAIYEYQDGSFEYVTGLSEWHAPDLTVWCAATSGETEYPLDSQDFANWTEFACTDDYIVYEATDGYKEHIRSIEERYEAALAQYGLYWNRYNGSIVNDMSAASCNRLNSAPVEHLYSGVNCLCDVNIFMRYNADGSLDINLYRTDGTGLLDKWR